MAVVADAVVAADVAVDAVVDAAAVAAVDAAAVAAAVAAAAADVDVAAPDVGAAPQLVQVALGADVDLLLVQVVPEIAEMEETAAEMPAEETENSQNYSTEELEDNLELFLDFLGKVCYNREGGVYLAP